RLNRSSQPSSRLYSMVPRLTEGDLGDLDCPSIVARVDQAVSPVEESDREVGLAAGRPWQGQIDLQLPIRQGYHVGKRQGAVFGDFCGRCQIKDAHAVFSGTIVMQFELHL